MKYANIVFMQEHEAIEAENILNEKGIKATVNHLKQWDTGEYHETSDKPFHGSGDDTFKVDGYILSYNAHLPYIGLEKIIKD